jgi:hypothetical protein
VPNKIWTLSVDLLDDRPESLLPNSAPRWLIGNSTCFDAFDQLDDISFEPPPSDEFWTSASNLALSRVRVLTLSEGGLHSSSPSSFHDLGANNCLCALPFTNHVNRFTGLVNVTLYHACDVLSRMVELNAVLPRLEVLKAHFCFSPGNLETWRRVPALFPSLYRLDLATDGLEEISNLFVKEVVPNFANLRQVRLNVDGLRLETVLVLAVKLLKRNPRRYVSIVCLDEFSNEDSETTAALLDALGMIPSCRVENIPEGADGAGYFRIER